MPIKIVKDIYTIQEKQEKALKELIRVAKRGICFILIECCVEGITNLNRIRRKFNIKGLKTVWYNRFFKKKELEDILEQNGVKILKRTYFPVITILEKVIYPKLKKVHGVSRLFHVVYFILYFVDKNLCRYFPPLGYDFIYVCRKCG